ncbi:MAG TPA: MqnA/MqnD/SBP family protein [Thermoanaerobaculia bacterium]|nr:MqnA/MqnD/SBP family protein [Thermoanaerobaculia bacterium]
MPKLRVGIGDVLDARPLAWGFLKGHHADLFAPVLKPLPLMGRLLAQGGLDVGLAPAIDAARDPELLALPELCVAFPGEARSLVLVSPSPLSELRRVYLGRSARTAAAVARIVLAEGRNLEPEYLEADTTPFPGAVYEPGRPRLERHEGALLIGGAALRLALGGGAGRQGLQVLDLGTAWRELTGLPLVAGLWLVRSGTSMPDLAFYFKSSLRYGMASLSTISREAAAELGVDSEEIARFLHESVSYLLRDEELRGLEELVRRAARHGLAPAGAAIRFLPG